MNLQLLQESPQYWGYFSSSLSNSRSNTQHNPKSSGFTMASPRAILDLDAWSNSIPKERANDTEYNVLVCKFKALLNEVKLYQEHHSDCSVSRAIRDTRPSAQDRATASPVPKLACMPAQTTPSSSINSPTKSRVSALASLINGQQHQPVSPTKKTPFFHQNSMPVGSYSNSLLSSRLNSQRQNDLSHTSASLNHQDSTSLQPHHNSSYNISNTSQARKSPPQQPEVRRRNGTTNSQPSISRSSERLDSINNNHLQFSTSDMRHETVEPIQKKPSSDAVVVRDGRYMFDDANIYDAVSPDDAILEKPNNSQSRASQSIHNLNMPTPHLNTRDKIEPNSALGLSLNSTLFDSRPGAPQMSENIDRTSTANRMFEPNKSQHSLGSSVFLEANNLTSSTASLSVRNREQFVSPLYSNYVNIDYFLRRGESPSFENNDDDEDDDINEATVSTDDESGEEDTTQLSHSLSSDQNCEDALRDMSPRELARKLSSKVEHGSSTSITPASSGDFLNDTRAQPAIHVSPIYRRLPIAEDLKSSNMYRLTNFENDDMIKDSTSPKSGSQKYSPSSQTYEANREDLTNLNLSQMHSSITSNKSEKDDNALFEANNTMRSFLSDLNLTPADDFFEDKAQRRIVKESFAVEFCGRRKLRHLFLFNDVIVCAKYQASSKQKFTFDVKWYLNLNRVSIVDLGEVSNLIKFDREAMDAQILDIRTNLMLLRGQMQHLKRSKHKQPSKVIKKLKKKRTELEAELVLLLPHLPLVIKHQSGKKYTFFLSSNFDRNQWIESIKFLQSQLPPATKGSSSSPSSTELQAWIQTCRKNLNPTLGTFLLRSNCDDDLLYGDLYINLNSISGISKPGHYYFCFEVDSYGHFSQKASTLVLNIEQTDHELNEEYVFPLDGAHTLRILLYEDLGLNNKPSVVGKSHVELSRSWFLDTPVDKIISFNSNCNLRTKLSYSSSELLTMRIPHTKLCPTFGMDITQVCKKEKTSVPLLIQLCVNEVERRGMREVGIYRMSGTSTDIQRLKKAFETNSYVAELLLRDIDINSVTGFLKTYLREIPEGLFSNKLYLKFVSAFNIPQSESIERTRTMLELFHMIPVTNQQTIIYLVEHLVKVNRYESHNKMSLTNLATVLGPNILKPPTESSATNTSDPFTAVVIGSMSQAGILYFFLNRKYSNLPLMELDSSELVKPVSDAQNSMTPNKR